MRHNHGARLDNDRVLDFLHTHVPESEYQNHPDKYPSEVWRVAPEPSERDENGEETYVLVMPHSETTLEKALRGERIADQDVNAIRAIITAVVQAVAHLHQHNLAHNDLKPRIVVRQTHDNSKWCLIGLESAAPFGDDINSWKYSEAYVPPERQATLLPTRTDGQPHSGQPGFPASAASDAWAVGVMLFELTASTQLFKKDFNNDVLRLPADQKAPR